MKTDNKINVKDRFTGTMFRRLFIPAMFSSVGWALSDIADAVVVGQKLGTVGLAAISLILPVYMLNCMFAHGLGISGSVRYSFCLASGDVKKAKGCFSSIFALTLILSVGTAALGTVFIQPLLSLLGTTPADKELYTATLSYLRIQLFAAPLFYLSNVFNYFLRNDGNEKLAGVGSVVGNVSDIVLNVLLVIVFNLGTGGAALATAIGQIITVSIYLPGFFSKDHYLRFGLPLKGWFTDSVRMLIKGLASSVNYLYQLVFLLLCNNLLKRIGGETGIAVFDIIQNTSYLILYLYDGTSRAMQPVLSTYYGEQNEDGKRNLLRVGFTTGVITGSVMIIPAAIYPGWLCALFGIAGSEAEPLAHTAIRIFVFGAFFAGISMLLSNYFQSIRREKLSFMIMTLRGAVILLPVMFICESLGLGGFWWMFPITETLSLLIGFSIILILKKRRKNYDQRVDEARVFRRTITSSKDEVASVSAEIGEFCERWEAPFKQQYSVMMAVEELGVAIIQHGFEDRSDGYIQITVIALENGDFELHLRDDAKSFDPFSLNTQRASSLQDADMDTIGVYMIKERSKDFVYRKYQGFNTLIVRI